MTQISLKDRLGFELPGFDTLDEFSKDEKGFCYYDEHSHSFYTCDRSDVDDWWNEQTMNLIIDCPYCESTVGGFHDHDRPYVKQWMGKHLALLHKIEVETDLLKKEQREEYHYHRSPYMAAIDHHRL